MQTQVPATIPETVDFVRQVEINRTIEGVYPISKLARLSESLLSSEGSNKGYVTAKLEFTNSVGIASLKGRVSAKVQIECQRCLEPVETELSGRFKFALVNSEEEFDLLPEEFEPYLIEGDEQSIVDLIEDELLLSLPMVTIHTDECSDYMLKQNKVAQAEIEAAQNANKEAENPFAALQALKEDLGNKVN